MWLVLKEKQVGEGNAKINNVNMLSDKHPEGKAPLKKDH